MSTVTSVYQQVLGERFDDLDPALRRYFGALPSGRAGVGTGIYDIAGPTGRALTPLLRWSARRGILFPEFARNVPFTVANIPESDGALRGIRNFALPTRTRTMRDRMIVSGGRIIDRLGDHGELEVALDASVIGGELRLTSRALALRLGGRRLPLPRIATVTVTERAAPVGQHVDVRIRVLLLGEMFRYAGTFTYAHVPLDELDSALRTMPG